MRNRTIEVAVVGGGPAGLTLAIALASAGIETALIILPSRPSDNRTTALLASSVTALETLGVWQSCRDQAAPLRAIRLIDDTARLLRAPEVVFAAAEIGLDAFGQNLENRFLLAALQARAGALASLRVIEDKAQALAIEDQQVTIRLEQGEPVVAQLAIGADGKRSLCREAARIATYRQSYGESALTFNLAHQRPHQDISTEFHTERGPFTLVPLPGSHSSLVLVTAAREAERIAALSWDDLAQEIERRSHSILGKIDAQAGHGLFPLSIERAHRFGNRRVALIGEAAHFIPPIGAQGLNLGLRDAAAIAELVVAARRDGADLGGADLLARYDASRRIDVGSRTLAVDFLHRSLLSDFLPMQAARGLALSFLDHIGPLRRAIMREGVAPATAQLRLMRGEKL